MISLLFSLALAAPDAPEPEGRAHTLFFGLNFGAGAAWVRQPGLSGAARPGIQYDASFGFGLTRHWAAGVELSTWQPLNVPGDPTHVHSFAPRLEYSFGKQDGWVAATAVGLALGDGIATKRLGLALSGQLGYRFAVAKGVTLALETGARLGLYADGRSAVPFVAVQLRFWGQTELFTKR